MHLNWSRFNMPYKKRFIENKVPALPGVYVLYVEMENGKWDCFFVGNTSNMHDSMMAHLEEKENEGVRENVTDYVCGFEYASVEDEDERASAVKYLFDRLKPDCMEDPGGKGKRVNVARKW